MVVFLHHRKNHSISGTLAVQSLLESWVQQPTAGIYSFQSSFSIANGPQSVSEIQVNCGTSSF